ncbi:hypothetical protein [Streptomyces sp. NPDC000878]
MPKHSEWRTATRAGGTRSPVPQRGQQDAPDLVQGEGVTTRVGVVRHGRDGEDDVFRQPQQGEGQLTSIGDGHAVYGCTGVLAALLQRQDVVEGELHLLGGQRRAGRNLVRHRGLINGFVAVPITATNPMLRPFPCG